MSIQISRQIEAMRIEKEAIERQLKGLCGLLLELRGKKKELADNHNNVEVLPKAGLQGSKVQPLLHSLIEIRMLNL